ncbi:MAG: TonB-dependent receptor [Bacteroidetes bacterium]|nr:TonB-dependent receptor [Rhodothermia bacterium]MCS7155371.1 TonB-dependent receptor [Bacteroidota bacterium]MCX7907536.1 TonB-dependent receptor [Bacteroidota bacterium]MDW8138530.1 TonB-dependent receptor [Bacteroidota bacterium]MDW8284533.1 TonB-dependent receptor [Bacteroidota bacterium]
MLLFVLIPLALQEPSRDSSAWERDTLRFRLPELTVLATRTPVEPQTAPGRLERLRRDSLWAPTGSVGELLRAYTTLHVRTYGPGALATLGWRGTDGAHTLVLLDGLPLGNGQNATVDLELLPAFLWQAVELAAGPGSAVYGSAALGGVLRLQPPMPPEGSGEVHLQSRLNSYGLREGALRLGGRYRGLWGELAGYGVQNPNRFPYQDNTVYPPVWRRRQNADYERAGLWMRAGYGRGRWRLQLAHWSAGSDRGVPGPIVAGTGRARQRDHLAYGWGELLYEHPGLQHRLLLAHQEDVLRYTDPDVGITSRHRNTGWTAWYEGARLLGAGAHFAWGLLYRQQGVRSANLQTSGDRRAGSLYVSGAIRPRPGWLVYPALRADLYSDAQDVVSPRLGLNVALAPGWALKAQLGHSYRVPTFNDLYWIGGGNPELKPERSWGLDWGVRYEGQTLQAELTLSGYDIRQRITWLPDPDGRWRAQNQGHVRIGGLEVSAHWHPSTSLLFWAAYTGLEARKLDRSGPADQTYRKFLIYLPPHLARVGGRLRRGALEAELRGLYSSWRYTSADNSSWLPSYGQLDLTLGYRARWRAAALHARLAIENLLNAGYQVIPYYPMPGRSLTFGLTLSWFLKP